MVSRLALAFACMSAVLICSSAAAQSPAKVQDQLNVSPRIWTNEDLTELRKTSEISVVGPAMMPSAVGPESYPPTVSPKEEANAEWYGRQLAGLHSEVGEVREQLRQISLARTSGGAVSDALAVETGRMGSSADEMSKSLREREHHLENKIEALHDLARHNSVEPGLIRSSEDQATENGGTSQTDRQISEEVSAGTGVPLESPDAERDPEAYWRHRFATSRLKLKDAKSRLQALRQESTDVLLPFYPDPRMAFGDAYTPETLFAYQRAVAEQERQVQQLTQHLSDLEDDLRKSGGEPGWARE